MVLAWKTRDETGKFRNMDETRDETETETET